MLNFSYRAICMACGAYMAMLVFVPTVYSQEPAAPQPKPKAEAPAAAASPSDVQPPAAKVEPKQPAEPQATAEPKPVAAPAQGAPAAAAPTPLPLFDYTRLAHPSVADQLELSDEQRSAVAQLVNQRANELASAPPQQRQQILAASDQKLAALLNDSQRAKLTTLASEQKLRFNFRFQKWADVLDWFAHRPVWRW